MKVSELIGAKLDYWVAMALGDRLARVVGAEEHERCETRFGEQWPWNRFMPSRAWMDGGPIFEREGFGICKFHEPTDGPIPEGGEWCALWRDDSKRADGPTPLIAGMRLFVMSKYGEEVPDAGEEE